MRSSEAEVERILVIKLADVGDLLTITPALRALRQQFPEAEITALVTPGSRGVLDGNPNVDRVIPFDKFLFDRVVDALHPAALAGAIRFAVELRRYQFDRVILMHHLVTKWGLLKWGALLLATGAGRRLGIADRPVPFLTELVADGGFGARHEVEHWLALVAAWGATTDDTRTELHLTPAHRAAAADWLRGAARPIVAIAPGSGTYSTARRWPAERFGAVAARLAREAGATIVVGGTRDEVALAHRVAAAGPAGVRVLAGLTSLHDWAAILERCDLLITNDSGAGHLAAACGTPVVSVFGPSNDRAWRPWDAGAGTVRVVSRRLACRPCFYVGTSLGRREGCGRPVCLTGIDVDEVVAAGLDLLGRRSSVASSQGQAEPGIL